MKAGEPAPAAGQFWSQENAFELIAIFARTELDLTKSLARIRTLEADKRELQAIIRHEQGKVRIAEQDVVIEKLKCPSLLERKLGWTIGLSGGYNIVAEADQTAAYAGVGACWGWHL